MNSFASTSLVVLLFVLGAAASVRQQVQQSESGQVSGVLVAGDTGEPVRKATVTLASASPRRTISATSDADGRFVLDVVPPGQYTLTAVRPGFVTMVYGARLPGTGQRGLPISVSAGQRIERLNLAMPRAGAIAGIVTDEYGDPAYNVPVRALRYAYDNGHRVVRTAGTGTTNDLGEYRIAHLEPGEYMVTAVPRDTVASSAARAQSIQRLQAGRAAAAAAGDREARAAVATMTQAQREGRMPPPVDPVGYVPMYYPRAVLPSMASTVSVGLGSQVLGIDIRLEVVRTGTVSGPVMDEDGRPIQGNLKLIDPAMPVSSIGAWFTSSSPDGQFAFHGVVPGAYVLGGNNSPPGTIGGAPESGGVFQMSAPVPVLVGDADVSGAEVRMAPVSTIAGRVDFASIAAPVNHAEFRINFLPVTTPADWEMGIYRVVPEADGSFVIPSVVAARYRVDVAGAPDGWMLESATFNGAETVDTHLVVEPGGQYENGVLTLTNRTSSVSGTVTNERGLAVNEHVVILFPERREARVPRSRRIQVARTGPDGRYSFDGLLAGEYRLAVVVDLESGREFEPAFLEELAAASLPVALSPGQNSVQDVRVR